MEEIVQQLIGIKIGLYAISWALWFMLIFKDMKSDMSELHEITKKFEELIGCIRAKNWK